MTSLFLKIISREIPARIVAEDQDHLAFLDIRPVKRGHVLVIPKREVDYIFDMEDEALSRLHLFSKKVAVALKQAVPCTKVGVAVVGLEVPHVHIHLIPMDSIQDLNFSSPRLELSDQELDRISQSIQHHMNR